jgi:hypothetical protein
LPGHAAADCSRPSTRRAPSRGARRIRSKPTSGCVSSAPCSPTNTLDLRDRVAGCLLLVFAQPITRLARLTVDDVDDRRQPVRLRLGPEPLELPEPLGSLGVELKDRRPGLAATVAREPGRWLFPGLRLDAPLHPEQMRRRLRRVGIIARPGRAAALMHLAQTLPPAILADLLGISESRAADWTRAATGDWARYAAAASLRAQLRIALIACSRCGVSRGAPSLRVPYSFT